MKRSKLWSGLTSTSAALLVVGLIGQNLAAANASYINTALGTTTTKVVQTGEVGDTTYFKSQFGDFDDPDAQAAAIAAALEQNVNEMREGAALLRNENNTLPLTNATRISVFGHAAVDPAYQANSAGNKVTNGALNSIDLKTALEAQGFEVNPQLWDGIAAGTATRAQGEAPQFGGGYSVTGTATNTEENKAFYQGLANTWANDYKDAAIVVFAREGGEGHDLLMDDVDTDGSTISSLALHKDERDLLEMVRKDFDKVIVLLNSPYQMEVQDIIPYADSILFIGYPGHQGFTGVAEILKGTVNPSGHLTDTYATDSLSSPAAVNSGTRTPQFANVAEINATIGEDENAEYMSFQAEGIYIGYRYYETRYADAVMGQGNATAPVGALEGASSWNYADEVQYPFGYGLSYTTFDQKLDSVDVGEDEITAKVTVTNTGDMAGKSVVQLYAQTPYGDYERQHGVEKSAIQLAGFGKTQELAPGASETVTITVDKYLLASYDTTAHDGAGGYILSDGDYYLAIGEDSHDALNNVLAAEGYTAANGMTAEGTAAKTYSFKQSFDDDKYRTGENGAIVSNQFADAGLNLAMMKDVPLSDHETWLKFIYQLQPEDLPNATAESFQSPAVGDLSPAFAVGDGCDSVGGTYPLTVEFNGEQVNPVTTRYCSNVVLAGTFNADLYAGRGTMMGEDGMWSGYMINYNLGNDLHRTPFGGRNFEYMSECPILNYLAGAVEVEAMEKTGSHAGPKHFVGNDQEFYREGLVCFFNEQAFREGNLKAFEGSIRVANAGGLMQSFERLGLKWYSASYALNTTILRNEWGWNGAIDTDAAPCFDEYVDGGYKNHAAEVLDAGTQEWCLDGVGGHGQWILQKAKDTDDGHLLELLTEAAISWEYAISRSVVTNGTASNSVIEHVTPYWQTAITAEIAVTGILTAVFSVLLVLSKTKKKAKKQ